MLNVVAIQGRLTADPELKTTQSGTAVCSFTLACDRSFVKQGEERQCDFIEVVAWRTSAEFVCKYFSKGQMMAVTGRLQTRNYEDKQGNKRKAVEIVAAEVNFCGSKGESSGTGTGSGHSSRHSTAPAASYGGGEYASDAIDRDLDNYFNGSDEDSPYYDDLPF